MTKAERKEIIRDKFGSMARLGRKLEPPVQRRLVAFQVNGERNDPELRTRIAEALEMEVSELWPSDLQAGELNVSNVKRKSRINQGKKGFNL